MGQQIVTALKAQFAEKRGTKEVDGGDYDEFDDKDQDDLELADRKARQGDSARLSMLLKALLCAQADLATTRSQTENTPGLIELLEQKETKLRQDIMEANDAGMRRDKFLGYAQGVLAQRMALHKGKAARVEKIATQTSKLHATWSLYLESLRGPSGFGCHAKNPAEMQRQIDAEVDTLIKMALGFAMDPSRRKVAAAMGFATRTGVTLSQGAALRAAAAGGGSAAAAAAAEAGATAARALKKREAGNCYPNARAFVGAGGILKKEACYTCGKIAHDSHECPAGFYAAVGTPMPGFDRFGVMIDEPAYWKDGKPGSMMSKEIALLWEAHAKGREDFDETASGPKMTASILHGLATSF